MYIINIGFWYPAYQYPKSFIHPTATTRSYIHTNPSTRPDPRPTPLPRPQLITTRPRTSGSLITVVACTFDVRVLCDDC